MSFFYTDHYIRPDVGVSVSSGPDGALIGRDRTGQVLAVVTTSHLTPDQRNDLAAIYRLLAATIQEPS
ncbi:hypothetical protein [Gordonia iterans]